MGGSDVALYRRIFAAQASGDLRAADADIGQVRDRILMGYVLAQRYLAPGFTAGYEDLAAWLRDHNDLPDAPAIYRLALSRRTGGAEELTPATVVRATRLGIVEGANVPSKTTVTGLVGLREAGDSTRIPVSEILTSVARVPCGERRTAVMEGTSDAGRLTATRFSGSDIEGQDGRVRLVRAGSASAWQSV